MSSTNKTAHLQLSQFTDTDTPKWLTDYNQDMRNIDQFSGSKNAANGLAGLNEHGKLMQMPSPEDIGAAKASDIPTGVIFQWTTSQAPEGFLLCNGQTVSRNIYAKLFSVIKTTFGEGDGNTTFQIPDMRVRVPIGAGESFSIGEKGGEPNQDLVACIGEVVNDQKNIGYLSAPAPITPYSAAISGAQGATGDWEANAGSKVLQNDGSAPTTMQPYLVLNYIIKY